MVRLNANYDRNVSARGPVLAQLYHVSELTTHTIARTETCTLPHMHVHMGNTENGISHC